MAYEVSFMGMAPPPAFSQDGSTLTSSNTTPGNPITTAVTLTTSGTGRRIYALIAANAANNTQTSLALTISGGGLTWVKEVEAKWWERGTAIYSAAAPDALSSATITATATDSNGVNGVALTVLAFAGASATPGAEGTITADNTTPRGTIAGKVAGSEVLAVGSYYSSAAAPTVTANASFLQSGTLVSNGQHFAARLTDTSSTGSITIGSSTPASVGSSVCVLEVLAA